MTDREQQALALLSELTRDGLVVGLRGDSGFAVSSPTGVSRELTAEEQRICRDLKPEILAELRHRAYMLDLRLALDEISGAWAAANLDPGTTPIPLPVVVAEGELDRAAANVGQDIGTARHALKDWRLAWLAAIAKASR